MTGPMLASLAVAGLAGLAALALVGSRRRGRPARRPIRSPVRSGGAVSPERATELWPRRVRLDRRRCTAGLAGIAAALLLGGWVGIVVGAGLAVALDQGLRRLQSASGRAQLRAEASDLPLAADLLAVALRGGAPVDRATAAVADALPGPLGDRLARVGRVLRLGGTPAEAWQQLGPVDGADRLVRAAVRSAEHGSALAGALGRLADDLRADRAVAAEAAARRAGVLVVLPLGLCFLPAFILAGLVPVIVAILGDVL